MRRLQTSGAVPTLNVANGSRGARHPADLAAAKPPPDSRCHEAAVGRFRLPATSRPTSQGEAGGRLQAFYAKKPELKAAVAAAPGYGVFTTYGVSFLVGGSGGTGVVHDNKTQANTFMKMGAASAGLQIGASESDVLVIFKSAQAMNDFVNKGWTSGGTATAGAGADGKTAGAGVGSSMMENASSYTMTKTGVEAGVALGGSKFWKDADLN